jgi:hypothetical protein
MTNTSTGWKSKIMRAVEEKSSLIDTLNDFDENDWKHFIRGITEETISFADIPALVFEEQPIVLFTTVFSRLSKDSHRFISDAVISSLELLLSSDLSDSKSATIKKIAKNSFFIIYATPIHLEARDLLEKLALKQELDSNLRTDAACILASQENSPDESWWKNLVTTDADMTLAPMAVGALTKQSISLAIEFMNSLNPDSVSGKEGNFRIVIMGLLEAIPPNKGRQLFLNFFPKWSISIIEQLLESSRLKYLKDELIRGNIEAKVVEDNFSTAPMSVGIKNFLPARDYAPRIDNDEVSENIAQKLSKSKYGIFLVSSNYQRNWEPTVALTTRAVSLAYRFSTDPYKNQFASVVFIGSNAGGLDAILDIIGDALGSEFIKRASGLSIKVDIAVESLKTADPKVLIIVDDFHDRTSEARGEMLRFFSKVRRNCKFVMTTKFANETTKTSELLQEMSEEPMPFDDFILYPSKDSEQGAASYQESISHLNSLNKYVLDFISIFSSKVSHELILRPDMLTGNSSTLSKSSPSEVKLAIGQLRQLALVSLTPQEELLVSSSVRKYVLSQLQDEKRTESKIFQQLTSYYIDFTRKYGGDSQEGYEMIKMEWYSILAVLEWNKTRNIKAVEDMWLAVNHFADLYGYWGERQKWLGVLINHYRNDVRIDEDVFARCLSSKGWTLTMLKSRSSYKEAQDLFEEAKKLKMIAPATKSSLSHNATVLSYHQERLEQEDVKEIGKYSESKKRLEEQRTEYNNLKSLFDNHQLDGTFTESSLRRHEINLMRNEAKIMLLENDWENAYRKYVSCFLAADAMNWSRMVSYFHCMLAESLLGQIKSESNSQEKNEKSGEFLEHVFEGSKLACDNQNKRRLWGFMKLYTSWQEQMNHPIVVSHEWHKLAPQQEKFDKLLAKSDDYSESGKFVA